MKCDKHSQGMIVLHAFSDGECEVCGQEVVTAHIPCDEVCERCSEDNNLCQVCGEKISKVTVKIGHVTDIDEGVVTCLLRAEKEIHDEIEFNIETLTEEQLQYVEIGNTMRFNKETYEIEFMKEDMSYIQPNYELEYCETCIQMTNHLYGKCQKHKK